MSQQSTFEKDIMHITDIELYFIFWYWLAFRFTKEKSTDIELDVEALCIV